MDKIAILLCTYNSELFLKEQIDSIITQSNTEWKLYIRDDGSQDGTLALINHYSSISERVIYVDDEVKHRGARDGFMWLLKHVEAAFYMFCDHDDVWLPEKIEKSYALMKESENDRPVIIHSDLIVTDEYLQIISDSFWRFSKRRPQYSSSFWYHCAYNNITGCTMIINRTAREIALNMPSSAKMHDSWIALAVSFNNGVVNYISEPLIYYRQHINNAIGARKSRSIIGKLVNIKKIINENIQLYKTIQSLTPISPVRFIFNKIRFYLLFIFTPGE